MTEKSPKSKRNCGCERAVGSKKEVWNGEAKHTAGGLHKSDLMKNKRGKIVSKKQHAMAMKNLKPFQLVKPNCQKNKGPVTFICGAKSKGANLVDHAVVGEKDAPKACLSPIRKRTMRAVRKY